MVRICDGCGVLSCPAVCHFSISKLAGRLIHGRPAFFRDPIGMSYRPQKLYQPDTPGRRDSDKLILSGDVYKMGREALLAEAVAGSRTADDLQIDERSFKGHPYGEAAGAEASTPLTTSRPPTSPVIAGVEGLRI